MNNDADWIKALKVGDEVLVQGGGIHHPLWRGTVVAFTTTGRIKVQHGRTTTTFYRTGNEVTGSRLYVEKLLFPTPDRLLQIDGDTARARLRYAKWDISDAEAIAAVEALRAAAIPGFAEASNE